MPLVLEVEQLEFSYPGAIPALRKVSFSVAKGEKVALLGPNGAGKSTLLLHLNGILMGNGRVTVMGLPVCRGNLESIRAEIGLVFQNPDDQLFCPTVLEDVEYGPRCRGKKGEELRLESARALELVGMQGYEQRFPQDLSEGQKKRVALATVLSMQPHLLALDEPTAGLDARARRTVINILKSLPQALVTATHDLDLAAEISERALILDDGRVAYDGPISEALADRELLISHGLLA